MQTTWIVLADGSKAKVFQYQGPNAPLLRLDDGKLHHTHAPSHELVSNKRGRTMQSADATRFGQGASARPAMANPTDPHTYEKQVFAKEVADFLENNRDNVDRIILAADPNTLGELRHDMSDQVKEKISDELDKDLTNLPEKDLPKHLQDVLYVNA